MKIKGRALSRKQRDNTGWAGTGWKRQAQAQFDGIHDRPTKPKSKKRRKGLRTFIDAKGNYVVKWQGKPDSSSFRHIISNPGSVEAAAVCWHIDANNISDFSMFRTQAEKDWQELIISCQPASCSRQQ